MNIFLTLLALLAALCFFGCATDGLEIEDVSCDSAADCLPGERCILWRRTPGEPTEPLQECSDGAPGNACLVKADCASDVCDEGVCQ